MTDNEPLGFSELGFNESAPRGTEDSVVAPTPWVAAYVRAIARG